MYENENMNGEENKVIDNVENTTTQEREFYNTYAGSTYSYSEPVVTKPVKKKGKVGKVLGIVAAAIGCGAVAGAIFFCVNYGLNTLFKEDDKGVVDYKIPVSVSVDTSTAGDGASLVMDASDAAEAVMPAVVAVTSTISEELYYYGRFSLGTQEYESSGSGIIVGQSDTEILIVTNNHVIEDNSGVMITFIDDKVVPAVVKGAVPNMDIAVLAVATKDIEKETLEQIRVAKLGNSDNLRLGERVIAIGNALGLGQSVTQGGISAIGRSITVDNVTFDNMLQTDAAINSGNSGGALINVRGEVIGVNSAKYSSTGVEGIGYAIPISSVVDLINELMNRETREIVPEDERGVIGIGGYAVTSDGQQYYGTPAGVIIQYVEEGSAAEKAGLQQFDIITKFDGQSVTSVEDIQDLLQYYRAGETVTITIAYQENRKYVEHDIEITLGKAASTK
ncbi:MAG: trypsin-like peptidase domain-containing protein [Lachnospiraceae bacterium]|nr:trypsin-like peptidase domain-containing protein [Lachnospiraceae bacterium]